MSEYWKIKLCLPKLPVQKTFDFNEFDRKCNSEKVLTFYFLKSYS